MLSLSIAYGSPVVENPNCPQTTCASGVPQKSSHTVPHTPLRQTSTRPSFNDCPFTSLILPSVQSVMSSDKLHPRFLNLIFHTLCTAKSSIISMSVTEINHIESTIRTVNQSVLISTTKEVIKVDGSNTLTKEGISVGRRSCMWKTKTKEA